MKNKVEFEDVRELVNEIVYGNITRVHHRDRIDDAIVKWLKQFEFIEGVKVKEIPVGLTDSQIKSFIGKYCEDGVDKGVISVYREWASTQTFTHTNDGNSYESDGSVTDYQVEYNRIADDFDMLEEEYSKLQKEIEQLKTQPKFEPGWDKIPKDVQFIRIREEHLDESTSLITWFDLVPMIKRPVVEPKVEVGQIWEWSDKDTGANKVKILGICYDEVAHQSITSGWLKLEKISDFITKYHLLP